MWLRPRGPRTPIPILKTSRVRVVAPSVASDTVALAEQQVQDVSVVTSRATSVVIA